MIVVQQIHHDLPAWLEWLGSSAVCTVVTVIGVIATVYSIFVTMANRKLKLQLQSGQQRGAGGAIINVNAPGGTVSIRHRYLQTETKGDK